jgi:rod shape-determining protein MreC
MNNYSLRHKEKKIRLFSNAFLGVLTVVSMLVIVKIIFPNSLSGVFDFALVPFWKGKNFAVSKIVNSAELLRSKKALINENNNLKAQIQLNKLQLLSLDLFKQENIHLKELFDRQSLDVGNTVLGVVLARPSVSIYDTFVIDVGDKSGIKKDSYAYVEGNIFIGKIAEVYENKSLVKLFSSPGEIMRVSIGIENVLANAEGAGGGNFIAKLPRGVSIEKGDIITIPNISARIFAVVEEIESNPSDPFITILFKNPVNMNKIKWVQVVTRE